MTAEEPTAVILTGISPYYLYKPMYHFDGIITKAESATTKSLVHNHQFLCFESASTGINDNVVQSRL